MKRTFTFKCTLNSTEFFVPARSVAEAISRAKYTYASRYMRNVPRQLAISQIHDSTVHLQLGGVDEAYYTYLYRGFQQGANTTAENTILTQIQKVLTDLRKLR